MRRSELELTNKESIINILDLCKTIRLGMIVDGKPYVVPFVFGYTWEGEFPVIYMHCSLTGRKNKALTEGAEVFFEMDAEGPLMVPNTNFANDFSMEFSCIMGEGKIHFAQDDNEKIEYFTHIMQKQTGRSDFEYQSAWVAVANAFYIIPSKISASQKGMKNLV